MSAETNNSTAKDLDATPEEASFAETALTLGGKSREEAQRTGAIDKADDQVESLFSPQYQTVHSPAHRAVWERGIPIELFQSSEPDTPSDVMRVMDDSVMVVDRHRTAGTLMNAERKICDNVLRDLAEVGYWGLLVDREHGGTGACELFYVLFRIENDEVNVSIVERVVSFRA